MLQYPWKTMFQPDGESSTMLKTPQRNVKDDVF